jgi:hypothetical protein
VVSFPPTSQGRNHIVKGLQVVPSALSTYDERVPLRKHADASLWNESWATLGEEALVDLVLREKKPQEAMMLSPEAADEVTRPREGH